MTRMQTEEHKVSLRPDWWRCGAKRSLEYNEGDVSAASRTLPECMCAAYRDIEPQDLNDSPAIHSRRNEQENEDAWLVISAGTVVGDGCSYPYLFPAAVGRVHGLCQHAWDAAMARLHALD